jgi:peptide/nickel transport system permease protein
VLRGPARFIRTKPLGTLGAIIVLTTVLMACFADVLSVYPYDTPNYAVSLDPPSFAHPFGTDFLGRDLFSRLVYGARVSIFVVVGAVGFGTILSGLIGIVSGYVGGVFDLVVQRLVDAWMSVPPVLFFLFIMAIIGPGITNMIFVLGLVAIRESRVLRAAVLAVKENTYVEAARVVGCSHPRILVHYILPNVMPALIVLATLRAGAVILLEASLSFLGYGIPPPNPSWGRMLSFESRTYMLDAPWLAIWPGVFLSLTVFGWNVLGDALRDVLDPRLTGSEARREAGPVLSTPRSG